MSAPTQTPKDAITDLPLRSGDVAVEVGPPGSNFVVAARTALRCGLAAGQLQDPFTTRPFTLRQTVQTLQATTTCCRHVEHAGDAVGHGGGGNEAGDVGGISLARLRPALADLQARFAPLFTPEAERLAREPLRNAGDDDSTDIALRAFCGQEGVDLLAWKRALDGFLLSLRPDVTPASAGPDDPLEAVRESGFADTVLDYLCFVADELRAAVRQAEPEALRSVRAFLAARRPGAAAPSKGNPPPRSRADAFLPLLAGWMRGCTVVYRYMGDHFGPVVAAALARFCTPLHKPAEMRVAVHTSLARRLDAIARVWVATTDPAAVGLAATYDAVEDLTDRLKVTSERPFDEVRKDSHYEVFYAFMNVEQGSFAGIERLAAVVLPPDLYAATDGSRYTDGTYTSQLKKMPVA